MLIALLCACGPDAKNTNNNTDTTALQITIDTAVNDSIGAVDPAFSTQKDYADYYLVIADTGTNYYSLDAVMYKLASQSLMEIDTLGRYYDAKKKKIILPENYPDDLYAGEYVECHTLTDKLSLEYLKSYTTNTTDKNICLLAGMYETKETADSVCAVIKHFRPEAYVLAGRVYIGCMH